MRITKKLGFISTALTALTASMLIVFTQAAGSATLTLSPSSGSYANGSNFTITILENSGSDLINTVQADLTYDQSKLQFVSIGTSSSSFNYPIIASGGSGSVSIARGVSGGGTLSGQKTVATVTFKVLIGSGSSAISFAGSSAIVRPSDGQNVWNGSTTGGTYSFTTPATPPPPTTTPPPSTPGTTTTTPKPTTTTPKPGTTTTPTTTDPGTTDKEPTSEEDKPEAQGYLIAIKVVDSKNNPVVGQKVSLNNQTTETDQTGIASFVNVPAGSYEVTVGTDKGKTLASISVNENSQPTDVQQFEVRQKSKKGLPLVFVIPPIILVGLGALLWFGRKRMLLKKNTMKHFPFEQQSVEPKAIQPIDRVTGGQVFQAGETIHPTSHSSIEQKL